MNNKKILNISLAFLSVGSVAFIGGLFTAQNISENEYEKWQEDRRNQKLNSSKKYDKLVTNS